MLLTRQNTPRWLIFLIDITIVLFSLVLAYMLRFNFHIPEGELKYLPEVAGIILAVRGASFILARTYAGIIRYTSTQDAVRIFLVILAGSLLFAILNLITYHFINQRFIIPFSIIIIEFITVIFSMTTFRILVKIAYLEMVNPSGRRTRVIIFGAGEAGLITKRALDRDAGTHFKVAAFIDDDPRKHGKKLEGVTIHHPARLPELIRDQGADHVIIAIQQLKPERRQQIAEVCLERGIRVLSVPPVSHWINGQLSANQIRAMRIEDLLEREVIRLDEHKVSKELQGTRIMVTGAAGSIGSELVRQIIRYGPEMLLMIDQAESELFELDIELNDHHPDASYTIAVGDICNESRMDQLIRSHRPDIIYHAAAYKHVPMMEGNPAEAIITNVKGTRILADLAVKHGIRKFIMISTDKAVNPTSVMGASKRIAEIYTQSLNKTSQTQFITTRFGNVLGSNGSAVNLFRKQIEKGGPVTVTHREVTRFFMTIPEACQLVLEAGVMGQGGEIFLFDMGQPVRITDLAKKMIRLAGLEIGRDIEIRYTGLRPGEKLYEELLTSEENSLPTHHPRIMIGKVREYDIQEISNRISLLIQEASGGDDDRTVRAMKSIVPEYISQNSKFNVLDPKPVPGE
ncbi:MAG: polysaccharide biosynthesis protein [Bacteroidales bacterium]|nr:polysaccharide biosynthesis protein [Bacteroidales bacterium]